MRKIMCFFSFSLHVSDILPRFSLVHDSNKVHRAFIWETFIVQEWFVSLRIFNDAINEPDILNNFYFSTSNNN